MLQVRAAWDPELPVVASQAFTTGGRAFKDGDPFPWRELGITEQDAVTMWCSRLVDCVPATVQVAEVTQDMPGVTFAPPAAQLTRAERRALKRQG